MPEVDDSVLYVVEDKIARITLNRPDKRNALNDTMIAGIKRALREVLGDDHVRAIVITGSGRTSARGRISRRWKGYRKPQ
jgi:enoyl-CoA hydratase/carnithine racemase